MKKIYLLSAVACMFALNANAGGAEDLELFKNSNSTVKDLVFDQTSNCVTFNVASAGNPWDAQFNPPTWFGLTKKADVDFEISFDAMYVGEGTTDNPNVGAMTFIQGRQFGGYGGDLAALCEQLQIDAVDANWKLQGAVSQMLVPGKDADGNDTNVALNRNVTINPTAEWQTFSFTGILGKHAIDSVDMEWDFGTVAGTYSIKNFQLKVKGEVKYEYFMEPAGPVDAIADAAALKAYVANDVIYASEAADVFVYNINGVVVKSAKNVTSLNVADLKAGLYIAKFGNATVKFVK